MIISALDATVRAATGTTPAATTADWQCLVRRGMLHSECEAVEHWTLPPGATLELTSGHGVEEALLVLDGELVVAAATGDRPVRAGQIALVPHGAEGRVRAGDDPVRLITVRTLAAAVSDRLPPRIPELLTP
ncbi:cupin domain-containing protein [Streptomyces sp. uw30]|uniref:cupin domain-containing protein n=1 Tax=Streptomyces sp. uw30 TaxID=1828179 RepID=UPI0011CEBCDB|nr:cupin domain-containing protein [Streptomyces sp. uw30]TXS42140.1 cupin domain-containing protein [Streptomyces sp. uw30]